MFSLYVSGCYSYCFMYRLTRERQRAYTHHNKRTADGPLVNIRQQLTILPMMTSNDYYVWGVRGLRIEMRRQDKSVIDCYLEFFGFF